MYATRILLTLVVLFSINAAGIVEMPSQSDLSTGVKQLQESMKKYCQKDGVPGLSGTEEKSYVPDEIIIKFKDSSVGKAIKAQSSELPKAGTYPQMDNLNKKYNVKKLIPLVKETSQNGKIRKLLRKKTNLLTSDEKAEVKHYEKVQKAVKSTGIDRLYKMKVELKKGERLENVIQEYRALKEVEYVELNYKVKALNTPTDPLFSKQWALHNIGQAYPGGQGTADADIDAPEAWDIETGDSNVIIAVIDTGVDYTHQDINDNMWINSGEIAGNGIDDDENGFVDDIYGYDFCSYKQPPYEEPNILDRDSDPMDDHGHGTHCAGIIAAEGGTTDVAGVNWDAQIMALKFLNLYGGGGTADAIEAIIYAVDNHANVLSNSWGGGEYSQAMQDAINTAYAAKVVFVAAAGNDYIDYPAYPAAHNHVIAVAATDSSDHKSWFSNYGSWVDIAAPGEDILSLRATGTAMGSVYDNYTTVASGTSMACPHVAGACGLLLAQEPNLSPDEVELFLELYPDPIEQGICASNGRLNIYNSLKAVNGMGLLQIDSNVYSCSDQIHITLYDRNLVGISNASVVIQTSGGDFVEVSLPVTTLNWRFSGSVNTSGDAINPNDGTVQIAHGDTITVSYSDLNDGTGNQAQISENATADCQAPVIEDLQVDLPGPEPKVMVTTNESSSVLVRFGENSGNLNKQAEDANFKVSHTVRLKGVNPNTLYYYSVEVEDVAGNTTLYDNSGQFYTFVTDSPQDIYVPADCNNIQRAVDICWNGQTVYVANGTYTGQGNYDINLLGRVITVKSENGPENCVIDCRGAGRAFVIVQQDPNVVIEGFTIKNGHAKTCYNPDDMRDMYAGGAIYCLDAGCVIKECVFEDNSAFMWGGAVFVYEGNLEISDCIFNRNNVRTAMGGAIYCDGVLNMQNCCLSNNQVYQGLVGQGGAMFAGGNVSIDHCQCAVKGAGL